MQKYQRPPSLLHNPLDLEEPPEPPDLKDRLADDDTDDEDVPPLDAAVCALCGVAVGALADDDVRLLVLDLGEELGELLDCFSCVSQAFIRGGLKQVRGVKVQKAKGILGSVYVPSASNGSDGESDSET